MGVIREITEIITDIMGKVKRVITEIMRLTTKITRVILEISGVSNRNYRHRLQRLQKWLRR